jgi:S-adenosylmethionine:tRNA-ribosyltransferase-isomerase (queuine synthetase)
LRDASFAEFPSLLNPGDLLVLNDSRVIPARLYARRTRARKAATEKPTGRIEVMLTEPAGENLWRALVRPGRKVAIGERLVFPAPDGEIELEAEVLERGEFGERLLRFNRWTISLPCSTASATCRCRPTFAATMRRCRSRALPDRLFARARLGGRAHGRPALYAADAGCACRARR